MDIKNLELPDIRLVTPKRFEDARGYFAELFNMRAMQEALGLDAPFVQDNLSWSPRAGTVRALHLQSPPHAQGKLVRVTQGAIRDVAVDVRPGSATYGAHVARDLSAERLEMLWVPPGFAHGFVTLVPDTEVTFKTTAYYAPQAEIGVRWDDPDLAIDWGISPDAATISDQDRALPQLREITQ